VLRQNKHHNPRLQLTYNKYGESSLTYEVLEILPKNEIRAKEQEYLDIWHGKPECFNVSSVAEPGGRDTRSQEELKKTYSRKKSVEEREKISKSHRERTLEHGIRKLNERFEDSRLVAVWLAHIDGLKIPKVTFSETELKHLIPQARKLYMDCPRYAKGNETLSKIRLERRHQFKEWLMNNGFLFDNRRDSWLRKSKEDQENTVKLLAKYRQDARLNGT